MGAANPILCAGAGMVEPSAVSIRRRMVQFEVALGGTGRKLGEFVRREVKPEYR